MGEKVNFGARKVDLNQKTSLVKEVFSSVAEKYDLMNDIMSFGMHRLWKKQLMNYLPFFTDRHLLDMAGGTGDITIQYLKHSLKKEITPKVTLCDINENMLEIAKNKLIDLNYYKYTEILTVNAENLPFEDNVFDCYVISFGIRNITNINHALKEAHRVVKPGGKFVCLEFSKMSNSHIRKIYDLYSEKIIPKFGKFFASNEEAYQYLIESIKFFPNQDGFLQMITENGFNRAKFHNIFGGIAAIHFGYKI